jgi:small-conductance mechanosensitive channel
MLEILLGLIVIYIICVIPRAMLTNHICKCNGRLYDPKFKMEGSQYFINALPYIGSSKLCELLDLKILKYIVNILGVATIITVLNCLYIYTASNLSTEHVIVSITVHTVVLVANYAVEVLIAALSAKTFGGGWSLVSCWIPPLSFFLQKTAVSSFYHDNADTLRE